MSDYVSVCKYTKNLEETGKSEKILFLVLNSEIVQKALVAVLGSEAGVCQIAVDVPPFAKSAIVEQLQVIGNDKRNVAMVQTLLEHQQSAYTPIAILKRMDGLKTHMEVENVRY